MRGILIIPGNERVYRCNRESYCSDGIQHLVALDSDEYIIGKLKFSDVFLLNKLHACPKRRTREQHKII